MAGIIAVDTIQNGSGASVPTTTVINGSAKAWVNFDGAGATINGSFNVGSITKVATGKYTVNFITAMPNANYCACLSARNNAGASNILGVVAEIAGVYGTAVRTTSALGIVVMDGASGAVDSSSVNVAILSA